MENERSLVVRGGNDPGPLRTNGDACICAPSGVGAVVATKLYVYCLAIRRRERENRGKLPIFSTFPNGPLQVEQRRESELPLFSRCLTYPFQTAQRCCRVQSPGRGRLKQIPIGRRPSLHHLRSRHRRRFVRRLLRYYANVRLPSIVHDSGSAQRLRRPPRVARATQGMLGSLSSHAQNVRTCQGL